MEPDCIIKTFKLEKKKSPSAAAVGFGMLESRFLVSSLSNNYLAIRLSIMI